MKKNCALKALFSICVCNSDSQTDGSKHLSMTLSFKKRLLYIKKPFFFFKKSTNKSFYDKTQNDRKFIWILLFIID